MKNKFISILLLTLSVVTGSCGKWLEVTPKAEIPADKMFEKESGFNDALMACYVKMSSENLYGKELSIETIEHMAQFWDRDPMADQMPILFSQFNYSSSLCNEMIKKIYKELYNTIVQANLVSIKLGEKGDVIEEPALRSVIEGEALAIRAFCHFDVLRLFGQMPKNASFSISLPYTETASVDAIPYYTYSEYIKKIETDLNRAEGLLKTSDPVMKYTLEELNGVESTDYDAGPYLTHRRHRFNYWAVRALQARFYLYIDQPAKAATIALEVINAKKNDGTPLFSLGGSADFDKGRFTLPSETLFALSTPTVSDYAVKMIKEGKRTISETKKSDLFKERKVDSNNRYNKLWTSYSRTGGTTKIPTIRKYSIGLEPDATNIEDLEKLLYRQLIPIVRLSEMYLIAMEGSDLATANPLYIRYMEARDEKVSEFTSKDLLDSEIVNEYRREFWAEGQMFYTYKRLGSKSMMWKTDGMVNEANYSLPLPRTEINIKK